MVGHRRRQSIAGLGLCLLAGCVGYTPRPLDPARTASGLEARRLTDRGLLRALRAADSTLVLPPGAWTLRTLTLAGLYFSPTLAVARSDWDAARAAAISAGALPNPTLSGDVAVLTHGTTPSPSLLNTILDLPLITAGKRGIRVREAEARATARQLGVATAAWNVRTGVRDAALALWTAERFRDLSEQAVARESALVAMFQTQLDAGEVSALDVNRETVALERARAARRGAEMRAAAARVQLAGAIGVPVDALDSVQLRVDGFTALLPEPPQTSEARASALLARSDVRAALAEYAAAQFALQLEVARQYPNLSLGLGLHWEAELGGFTVTPSSVLPILNRNRGPIAEAEAARTAAAARFTEVQAVALTAVDHALAAYAAARGALQSADSAVTQQRAMTGRAEATYRAGESGRVGRVSAQLAAVAVEQEALAARAEALTALGAVETAMQRPLLGDAAWSLASPGTHLTTENRTP